MYNDFTVHAAGGGSFANIKKYVKYSPKITVFPLKSIFPKSLTNTENDVWGACTLQGASVNG